MSLTFGIYLVEQRIISPEQFCGLVKIQQETVMSIANIALRKNMLTIKQVANVLDIADANPEKSFLKIAMELDLIDRPDADQLLHHQQVHCPSIRKLIVECELLTQRQTSALFLHFERNGFGVKTQIPQKPMPQREETSQQAVVAGPRQPNFKKRPIVERELSQPNG